jgi:Cu/Ag efflux pump CusA
MIGRIIDGAIANRMFVVLAAIVLALAGIWAVQTTPVDALPDLSDVQVVIRSNYAGQAPRIVEDQVTYPLATTMLSVPGAKTVRGYSFFGDSYVYVIFEDGTDLYWARSRVLEYLNQVQGRLPEGVTSALGPDATGVGWIYEYALVDRSGHRDLAQLRSLQDWFLRYELKTVPGIAEVASIGGMVKQYQVVLDPQKLASYGVTHAQVVAAIQRANQEVGGSVLELARPNIWCARRAIFRNSMIFAQSRSRPRKPACPSLWATSPPSSSAPKCGAVSPNSTARGRLLAASSFFAKAPMRARRSLGSRRSSTNSRAGCLRAWNSSPPTIART